ncbi:MAG: DNA-binding protein [Gammaproteobacteria bacterium]|uniref:DNA-binding protein n=1 Tax=SAR86 cluster bacterium TaxID=2030880 RepID=A0A520MRD9_9GAMM|nr:MAG: DNA-binding protein [SAR86 cluster bacterium]
MNKIKIFVYLGLLLLNPLDLSAQSEQAIKVNEAYKYVGETKIVCGKIVSTKYLKRASGGPIFLNFGRDYPNQQMTGLIWFGRFSEYFSYKPEKFLKRKNVCVKGYISEYEGKTQMEIRTEKQIKLKE